MFIRLFKVMFQSESRLHISEFSGYHCISGCTAQTTKNAINNKLQALKNRLIKKMRHLFHLILEKFNSIEASFPNITVLTA